MIHAAQRFKLGKSQDGGVIFWQIDEMGVTRDGKIMFYRDDCHRDKSPGKHPTWVSARLKAWSGYQGELNVERCLFGLHQLPLAYMRHKPVAVVESEKTAVIMSQRRPDYLWMACGGLSMLQPKLLRPLHEQKVILCDDYFICVGPATRYLIGLLDASDFLHTGEVVCIARGTEPVKLCELFDEEVDDIRVFTDEQLWEEARFELSDYLRSGETRSLDNMVRFIVLEYALWLRNDYGIADYDERFWNNLESNLVNEL